MTTIEVLKTARGFARYGHGPGACGIGDWPDAADAFRRANRWTLFRWLPVSTTGMLVRAFDRAIRLAEAEQGRLIGGWPPMPRPIPPPPRPPPMPASSPETE